jgi:hypothetical protein
LVDRAATFGILSGSVPTSTTVFVFASTYGIEVDVVTTSVILSLLLSGPIMVASTFLFTAATEAPAALINTEAVASRVLSAVNIVAATWLVVAGALILKLRKLPLFYVCLCSGIQ